MVNRVGQQLGNYRLVRLLGRGSFAEVYLGEHVHLKTEVAVKVLHAQLTDSDAGGFLNEAQTIARLVHPHIVRVFDFNAREGTPFLVMDYAPNGTLRQRHPRGTPLPLATILPYVKQVADALQYAHDQKFTHRDVKPENMLLGRRNEVLLSDFGIALLTQSSRSQDTRDVAGTVAYMAPEQIQGKPRPASDQYSLGIVVYEWLCGDRPFHGSFIELCTQHIFASPPSLGEKIPIISPAVEEVVHTALAKDPYQRFKSVQAFANTLEQASQSVQATFVTPPRKLLVSQPGSPSLSTPPKQKAEISSPSAVVPPLLETELGASGVHSATEVKPVMEPPKGKKHAVSKASGEKVRVWSMGKHQVVAMVLGSILYGGLSQFEASLRFPSVAPFPFPIFPAIIIPVFFGAVFGPWVGLFTGGVGYFIGHFAFDHPFLWDDHLGLTVLGFVAGLTTLITGGRYNYARAIVIAEFIGAIGIVIGIGCGAYGDILAENSSVGEATGVFISTVLPDLILSLILLPILLVIYTVAVGRRGHL